MTLLSVCEYACLTTDPVPENTPSLAHIPRPAFNQLCRLCKQKSDFGHLKNSTTIQLDSWVGVLTTPEGLQLEILPKTQQRRDTIPLCRRRLIRMLRRVTDLPCMEAGTSEISLFEMPLTEWVARQFLLHLHKVVKQGLRFDYKRVEEEQPFLRGQLDVQRQIQQLPHRHSTSSIYATISSVRIVLKTGSYAARWMSSASSCAMPEIGVWPRLCVSCWQKSRPAAISPPISPAGAMTGSWLPTLQSGHGVNWYSADTCLRPSRTATSG